jgi:hypothetical protein
MLAATLVCLASLGQPPADRPDVFRGTVVEQGTNRPLPGVSVRVVDGFDAPTATTDARGRFDGIPTPDTSWFPVDGQGGPPLRVRAEDDRAWPWTAVDGEGRPARLSEHRQREAVQAVYEQQVGSRWKGRGPRAELVVECPPVGFVEAVVRGPDGRPLAETPIVLVPSGPFPFSMGPTIHLAGRTDQAGAFRIGAFEGPREFGVLVAEVGFGSTGPVMVVAGKASRPEMPPLAKFARIEGRLDDALKGPGAQVCLNSRPYDETSAPFARCDEEGRFTFVDLMPGDYSIGFRRGEERVSARAVQLKLGPGQVIRDVVVSPAPPPTPEMARMSLRMQRGMNGDPDQIVAWVEGTVRDETGRPLPGATVYAHLLYSTFMRAQTEARKATTDREGRYRVEGPPRPSMGTFSILVTAKGRPPVFAHAVSSETMNEPADFKSARLDVAVGAPGRGGSVAVKVVQDGRKVPGANVRLLTGATSQTFGEFIPPAVVSELDEMRAVAAPMAVTGADGVARFENVAPGVYNASAFPVLDPIQPFVKKGVIPGPRPVKGAARGIEVPPGGRIETTIAVEADAAPARFLLLGPDGAPVANRSVSVGFGPGRTVRSTTMVRTDERGECSVELGLGRWTIAARYQDTEPKSFPIQAEPFYQAEAQVPVSPALGDDRPIVLRATRRERGAIKARLLGLDGAPARGGVMFLSTFAGRAMRAGTVDEQGWVRFADMPSGKYRLRGAVDGSEPAPRPRNDGQRRLADEDLTNRATIFDREATVEPGVEAVVELRMESVAYVRATVHPPADRSPTDYHASLRADELPDDFPTFEVSEDRVDYLFGPLPAGRWPLVVTAAVMVDDNPPRARREVVVEPGRVVHVDVDAPPGAARASESRNWSLWGLPTGATNRLAVGADDALVTILMPDGATPAFGAQALFIPAGAREPVLMGTADAAGRLSWTGAQRTPRQAGEEQPEPAKEPTILAWALGGAGAAVATFKPGEPLRLTLPAPAGASGRVTVAGAAVAGRDAHIRVVLAAEGKGAVEAAMRRETTADAEGRFRFAGLVPGRYLVQAVRDELWASKAVPLVVESGEDSPPIDVDVPGPGATITLELGGRQGMPAVVAFSIKPPAGPIVDLAPIEGRADEQGMAIVRGLPAGLLRLDVEGDEQPHALDVPPARAGAGPLGVRVEVSRRGP